MRLIDAEDIAFAIEENSIEMNGEQVIEVSCAKALIDFAPTIEHDKKSLDYDYGFAEGCKRTREKYEWIPIKTRPLTEEEKEEYPDWSFMYDCPMPEDEQEVLVSTKWGVRTDIYCKDVDGCYFESYCDEDDVFAWMLFPQPYKEGDK